MISRVLLAVASRWRARMLRWRGATVVGKIWLRRVSVPRQAQRISIGNGAALDDGVVLLVNGSPAAAPAISIGQRVYVNRHTIIDASEHIALGDDCMVGPFCYITDHDHQTGADGRPASGELRSRPVKLAPRVWIGAHVTILKGVSIGEGAIVGAGSVVTRDVPAGITVVGNPARPIRRPGHAQ